MDTVLVMAALPCNDPNLRYVPVESGLGGPTMRRCSLKHHDAENQSSEDWVASGQLEVACGRRRRAVPAFAVALLTFVDGTTAPSSSAIGQVIIERHARCKILRRRNRNA